ncbi:glycosyltransferase [Roseomonas xinghualingensis]|uniref:glycosyltransferase n=1 Tax=Roseomonas xinghualingensis TaxID=2986475 RepID=UPI0021F16007|nr:glycosyltransferase [Roseomonas sp. SXEYE001]
MQLPPEQGLPRMETRRTAQDVLVATPLLPAGLDEARRDSAQRILLDELLRGPEANGPISVTWYYTPMALAFSGHLQSAVTVYDCMDELSAFRGASPGLQLLERRLIQRADVVFTGGRSLYEAKRNLHPRTHLFASGVDAVHFAQARTEIFHNAQPEDQRDLPYPRLGWFGVIDERMDLDLLREVALRRPDWSVVMLGPVVKIDPAALPRVPNVHWLGMKQHQHLPCYLASWNVGFMPFALNESTRYISPTKTPEYLAAGVPVVSTPVADVVHDWGSEGLVAIASDADAVIVAAEASMARARKPWLAQVDVRLARISWDGVWTGMADILRETGAEGRVSRMGGQASGQTSNSASFPHV